MSALPVSVGQEALWFLHRMAPDSSAYNVAVAVRLRGRLDIKMLRRALTTVVDRHEILRSAFVEEAGRIRRRVGTAESVLLGVRDLGAVAEEELRRTVGTLTRAPFALEKEVFRADLLRRTDDSVLVLTAHHIATDAYSQGIVLRDLIDAYEAGGRNDPKPLPATWDDHVTMERDTLESPRGAEMEAYWRQVLLGAPHVLELPVDKPRPSRRSLEGATHEVRLPDALVARLREVSFGRGITPFVFLMSVFHATLFRYCGQDDILVGWPTTTRTGSRTRNLVGYYVNSLALRSRFEQHTTFVDIFDSLDEQVKKGLSHVGYPFALLPRAVGLSRDPGRPPLTQVAATMVTTSRLDPLADMLAAGEAAERELELAGLRLSAFDVPQQEGQCDLSMEMLQSSTSFRLSFRYDIHLFERVTIERFARHFLRLVEAALSDPAVPVLSVSLVDAAERSRLLSLGAGAA
ncbi:condensation domain-containing protein [Streptomyces sp. UNOC14_S4]|uniref:condensation domain-containing protein n=1 Tax=Streptomyces sp. UNOC14_S4 TaxID=2872340 RepID=UPI001E44CBDC|nr:condensation domain-containing protein [Streptomyces sp. UNOC14_S4]MCC3767169.1 hypothetical protein [Streptomyces sp. UNOC14_S4]